jgi:hypothetical protein
MADQYALKEIYLSKEEFNKLLSDSRLTPLLVLARVVNTLLFCSHVLLGASEDDSPTGRRQHINSFLFACGVLYEGLKVANTLGKHFKDRDSFRDGFGQLLKDQETKKLQGTVLDTLRNKIAFHFDEDVVSTTVKNLGFPTYIFASGIGSRTGDIYYNLADESALNFILGEPMTEEEEMRIFGEALESVAKVLTAYVDSANKLIADVLLEMKWSFRQR